MKNNIHTQVQDALYTLFCEDPYPEAFYTARDLAERIPGATARSVAAVMREDASGQRPFWVETKEDTRLEYRQPFLPIARRCTVYRMSRAGIRSICAAFPA